MRKFLFLIGLLFSSLAFAATEQVNIVDRVNGKSATVVQYANSTPLTVRLTDTNGDYVAAGAGTQYTDAAAAPSHPTGTIPVFNNSGTITAVSAANPLPVTSTAATGSVTKIADINGNVYGSTIPVSLASVPSHAVTNAGTFAVQDTSATGSTQKIAGSTGLVPNTIANGSYNSLSVYLATGSTTTASSGTTVIIADKLGNALSSTSNALNVNVSSGLSNTQYGDGNAAAAATGTVAMAKFGNSIFSVNMDSNHSVYVISGTGSTISQATGSTIKVADSLGNVLTQSTANTTTSAIGLNVTPATGATIKIADKSGNAITSTSAGLDINWRYICTGSTVATNVGTATQGTLQVVTATGSTMLLNANPSVTIGTVNPGNTVNTTPWLVTPTPGTTGGWSAATESTLSSVVQIVKASAGNFGGYYFYNQNSSAAYLHVFDSATTAGATLITLKLIIGLPATSAANIEWGNGVTMANGICVNASTTATGNTATASPIEGSVLYK